MRFSLAVALLIDRVLGLAMKAHDGKVQIIDSSLTARAREYGEKAQEAVAKVRPFIEKSLKEQPMMTLAGAAVIASLEGAL